MGRVYNALVKAEKWKDGDRAIGRPDPRNSARGRAETAGPRLSFNVSAAATAQPAAEGSYIAAEAADFAATASARRPVVTPARLRVSESPVPAVPVITFEEPTEVSNLRDLAVDPRLAMLICEDPVAVERYRLLAAKLLDLANRRGLKTLLITSAEAGEGKTTIAAGVAWSLAKHPERRVLLIDANPTSPSIGRALGIDAKRGWMNLGDRSCELKHALVRLDPNGLYVMTPGAPGGFQHADALSSRLEEVIAEVAPRFDLVVVDSTAIFESSEAQRLAAVLDGTVIVARAGHTHHSKVTAARKLVPKDRRLGVVLNESEAETEVAHRRRGKSFFVGRLFGSKN